MFQKFTAVASTEYSPKIRPYDEEDDLAWWNAGLGALEANKLNRAERIFKKLELAQPERYYGSYGPGPGPIGYTFGHVFSDSASQESRRDCAT